MLWLRRRSAMAQSIEIANVEQAKSSSTLPVWALFFWLAQFRRWLRHLWREIVASSMFILTKKLYEVEVRGLEHFKYDPFTIVACSHKRDGDIPLVLPRLYFFLRPNRRKGLRMMYVVTRDDVHESGFLTLYFPTLDRWLRPFIARFRVTRLFKQLQTCPVKLPDEHTVNQLLHETKRLEGNLRLSEVLTPEWLVRLMGEEHAANPRLRLKDAIFKAPLNVLSQYATPRIFKEPLATRIMKRHHQTVVSQLYQISRVLDKGGVIFIAPEGRVTPDGRFGKMRAALTRVVSQTRADVKMTPVNVTYDFMDTLRPRAIINIGPEVLSLKLYSKNELAEVVRRSIAGLTCVTMSGLAGHWLIEAANRGQEGVSYHQLMNDLWSQAQKFKAQGLPLDQRLENRQDFEERLARLMAYAVEKGKIFRNSLAELQHLNPNTWFQLDHSALLQPSCQNHEDHPARYSHNELMSLIEAHNLVEEEPKSGSVLYDLAKERKQRRLTAG